MYLVNSERVYKVREAMTRYGYYYVMQDITTGRIQFLHELGSLYLDIELLEWFISLSDEDLPQFIEVRSIEVDLFIEKNLIVVPDASLATLVSMVLRRLSS